MKQVALLTSSNMVAGDANARADIHEFDLQFGALAPACASRGIKLVSVVWDAPQAPWTNFDAVVIGTTWDYMQRCDEFLAALDAIEADGVRLFNRAATVRWNLDKRYLAELTTRGAPTIPTLYKDEAGAETIAQAFDELGADTLIIKPAVGGGAYRLARIERGAPLPPAEELPDGAALIQPFLPSVQDQGEVSYLFYDGVFSHAVHKLPKAGEFRVQSIFGARETTYEPGTEEIARAKSVLDAVGEPLLYARVDMIAGPDGKPLLMELELAEPYHYPEQGPDCGAYFAAALERYLGAD